MLSNSNILFSFLAFLCFANASFTQISKQSPEAYLNDYYNKRLALCDSFLNIGYDMLARDIYNDQALKPYFEKNPEEKNNLAVKIDSVSRKRTQISYINELICRGSIAVKEKNYESAIGSFKQAHSRGKPFIDSLINSIPSDTIYTDFAYGLPNRLGYKPFYLHHQQIVATRTPPSDSAKLYLMKDTSLYTGVLVTKEIENGGSGYVGYNLVFLKYENGIIVDKYHKTYRPTLLAAKIYSLNPYLSIRLLPHYLSSNSSRKMDTVYTKHYDENGQILRDHKLVAPELFNKSDIYDAFGAFKLKHYAHFQNQNKFNSEIISYDSKGNIVGKSLHKANGEEVYHEEFKFTSSGNTISRYFSCIKDGQSRELTLLLDNNLDTLEFHTKINDKRQGLEYKNFHANQIDQTSNYFIIEWNEDTITNLKGRNLIFIDQKGKLIDKAVFISQVNAAGAKNWDVTKKIKRKEPSSEVFLWCVIKVSLDPDNEKKYYRQAKFLRRKNDKIIEKWLSQQDQRK